MNDSIIFRVTVTDPDGEFSTDFDALHRASAFAELCLRERREYFIAGQSVTVSVTASQED